MKSVKVFLGLLAGFATGALTGILFAPAKGSKYCNETKVWMTT
jgi:gas vesicle protein